jgi:Ni/Co efflux regulator RcnB
VKLEGIKMKKLLGLLTAVALATGIAAFAQDSGKDDMKQAGKDVKQAGKDTGKAAKHTAKGVKKETKKGVNKSAKATEKGAKKVKDKTDPSS